MWKFVLLFVLATDAVEAHEAMPTMGNPVGWFYGQECCAGIDCFQEKVGNVRETKDGYRIMSTGELIPYLDKRIKFSHDEYFHRCTQGGHPEWKTSICLYVPNRGY